MAPASALPIGATRSVSEMQPIMTNPAQPGSGLYNAVLALLAPPSADESERYDEEILDLHVVCFVVVYVKFSLLPCGIRLTWNTMKDRGRYSKQAHDHPGARSGIYDGTHCHRWFL